MGTCRTTQYEQLGGVKGALSGQADAALAKAVSAGGRNRDEVIAGLLRLVTVDEQDRPTRRRVCRDELPAPIAVELDAFVALRLLTTDSDNGTVVIGVAHEAFLSAWPPLAQAITASASALRAQRTVEQAAREWDDNGRPPARLWGARSDRRRISRYRCPDPLGPRIPARTTGPGGLAALASGAGHRSGRPQHAGA